MKRAHGFLTLLVEEMWLFVVVRITVDTGLQFDGADIVSLLSRLEVVETFIPQGLSHDVHACFVSMSGGWEP